jgi:hypothetical protein
MLRNLALNAEVIVTVLPDEKNAKPTPKKATVIEVITTTAARVAFDKDGNHTALVSHSLGGEPNTFHYPGEKLVDAPSANGAANK